MIRRPPRSTPKPSSAASDVYKRQLLTSTAKISLGLVMNTHRRCCNRTPIADLKRALHLSSNTWLLHKSIVFDKLGGLKPCRGVLRGRQRDSSTRLGFIQSKRSTADVKNLWVVEAHSTSISKTTIPDKIKFSGCTLVIMFRENIHHLSGGRANKTPSMMNLV